MHLPRRRTRSAQMRLALTVTCAMKAALVGPPVSGARSVLRPRPAAAAVRASQTGARARANGVTSESTAARRGASNSYRRGHPEPRIVQGQGDVAYFPRLEHDNDLTPRPAPMLGEMVQIQWPFDSSAGLLPAVTSGGQLIFRGHSRALDGHAIRSRASMLRLR
jgi:hypothetical protein